MKGSTGFTLIEVMVAITIGVVALLAANSLLSSSSSGHRWVLEQSSTQDDGRAALRDIADDVRNADAGSIVVTALADGNHELTLSTAIGAASGTVLWGAHDPSLGNDPASRDHSGWRIRYTVRAVAGASGTATRRALVRQALDGAGNVMSERVLTRRLHRGTDTPPGFRVQQVGSIWRISIAVRDQTATARLQEFTTDVFCWNSEE